MARRRQDCRLRPQSCQCGLSNRVLQAAKVPQVAADARRPPSFNRQSVRASDSNDVWGYPDWLAGRPRKTALDDCGILRRELDLLRALGDLSVASQRNSRYW